MAATIYDKLLLVKTEVTRGVDAVPVAATDAVRVKSFKLKKTTTALERKVVKQTMGALPNLIGKESLSLEIVAELRGNGAAGTPPEISPLILAARMAETIVASTSVTYKPSTLVANEKTATIYVYEDGLLWKMLAAVGSMKVEASMDNVLTASFNFQSGYLEPTIVTVPSGAVFDAAQPIVMTSATVVNDGAVIKVGKIGFDLGNSVQAHYVTGENTYSVSNRNPSMSLSKDSVNTAAEWAALSAGTNAAVSAVFGVTAGNIVTITAPVARRKDVTYGERGERILTDITYGLFESTSDDQIAIAFT